MPGNLTWRKEEIMETKYWSELTEEESQRATALAKPFNDVFCDDSDNSMSMHGKWMDENGFIFSVDDDLAGSTIDTVHERDLAKFLAQCMRPKPRK
jgi:hypothetical protein